MIDKDEALADMAATVDYLGGLIEEADTLDFETATDLREAAERIKKVAGELTSYLEGTMLKQLEAGSRDYGGKTWRRRKKYVERHDHTRLLAAAREHALQGALDRETGEIDPVAAINNVISDMQALYLSPSTKAKVTVADELGVSRDDFVTREHKGFELQVIDDDAGVG